MVQTMNTTHDTTPNTTQDTMQGTTRDALTPPEGALASMVHVTRWWAEACPELPVYRFLDDGREVSDALTFGALDRRARQVAVGLLARGLAGARARALVLFAPGLDFPVALLGCMYAGVVPVPAYPPEPHRLEHTLARLKAILRDARAEVVLTSTRIEAMGRALMGNVAGEGGVAWMTVESAEACDADAWTMPALDPEDVALLQYTSGSTSAPKGVMLTHASLMANLAMQREGYQGSARDVCVSWLPMYHDMGLIGNVLYPLYLGAQSVLMPPHAFLKAPMCWLEALSSWRATVAASPNFAFDLCVRKHDPAALRRLDLSSLRVLVNGAEPVRPGTVARFLDTFGPCGLRASAMAPSYGLAEVALLVSTGAPDARPLTLAVDPEALAAHRVVEITPGAHDATVLVSAGRTLRDAEIRIIDPHTLQPVSEDRVGEVWVRGPHVAAGYWGKADETAEAFDARTAAGEGPYLRTGDLGVLRGGELYITGRLKDMIVLRGRNLYPHDLEQTMSETRAQHPAVRPGCAAAATITRDGEAQLIVLQEVALERGPHSPEQIIAGLRQALASAHGVSPAHVILLERGTLPKTSSGKIMRLACARAFDAGLATSPLKVIAQDTREAPTPSPRAPAALRAPASPAHFKALQLQVWMISWVADQLATTPDALLDGHDPRDLGAIPLATFGLDSLMAVELVAALEDHLDCALDVEAIWSHDTLGALTEHLLRVAG